MIVAVVVEAVGMWETRSVFQAGYARVISTAQRRRLSRKLFRRQVAQATVRPLLVIVDPPAPVTTLAGKRIVFTGRLGITRSEAITMGVRAGAVVQRRVCHTTDVLVCGQDSPIWKADKKGQKLLDIDFEGERGHKVAVIDEKRYRQLV